MLKVHNSSCGLIEDHFEKSGFTAESLKLGCLTSGISQKLPSTSFFPTYEDMDNVVRHQHNTLHEDEDEFSGKFFEDKLCRGVPFFSRDNGEEL